jgi:hypothetical protein
VPRWRYRLTDSATGSAHCSGLVTGFRFRPIGRNLIAPTRSVFPDRPVGLGNPV